MHVAAKISVTSAAPTKPNMLRLNSATVRPFSAETRLMTVLITE